MYDPELAKKIDDFVDQLKNLLQVEKPFTLVRDGALLVIVNTAQQTMVSLPVSKPLQLTAVSVVQFVFLPVTAGH